jgi:nicotinate-nucleotide adenylyltransferase
MKITLYFGSFNPIHNGHLAVAQKVLDEKMSDELWLVVSPQNPLKEEEALWPEADRLAMVQLAIEGKEGIKASDYEFHLPRPSYTYQTLRRLKQDFPEHSFNVLIGGDNLEAFDRWRDHQKILDEFGLIVYPRPGYENEELVHHPNVTLLEAPLLDISSTEIRNRLRKGLSLVPLVPQGVADYILTKNFTQD